MLLPTVFAVSDLTLALIAAGSSLLGAGVGGGVTGFVSLRAERQRQGFERETELQRSHAAQEVAVRLTYAELIQNFALAQAVLQTKTFPPHPFPTAAWSEHGSELAALLSGREWAQMVQAYALVEARNGLGLGKPPQALSPMDEDDPDELLASLPGELHKAIAVLVPHTTGLSLPQEPSVTSQAAEDSD